MRSVALIVSGTIALLLTSIVGSTAIAMDAATRARLQASTRVGEDVIAALDAGDRVRVMIVFTAPIPRDPSRAQRRSAIAAARARVLARMDAREFVSRRSFEAIGAVAGDITGAGLLRLLDDPGVIRVDVDGGGSGQLSQAVPMVQLDDVHTQGYTGAGVTVAVIDSGIDTDHPDLSDSLVAEQCFCSGGGGCCPGGGTTGASAEDDNGHGTNVTGIVTSNGTVAPLGGAPDADVIAVKVLDAANGFCCSSDVIAGMDWVLNNHPETDVVNMSLGTFALFTGDCDTTNAVTIAFATAVDALTANGTAVFASSGNQASGTSMAAPACVANTISVGAVYDSNIGPITILGCTDATTAADQVTCFTNSNASTDLFAPGAPTTSTGVGGGTSTYYGTSQASPLSAACAAALRELNPALTPAEIETALEASPVLVTDATNGLMFPRLDCLNALDSLTPPTCPSTPQAGCRSASKSLLLMKDGGDPQDKLIWKWIKGATTTQAELSDPSVAGTDYSLCIYSGVGESLAFEVTVPGGAAGWDTLGDSGFKYKDPAGNIQGVQKVLLKGHDDNKSKILVKGKGGGLPDPDLSTITPPVRAQLRKSDDPLLCWDTTFVSGDVIKNDATQFKAKQSN